MIKISEKPFFFYLKLLSIFLTAVLSQNGFSQQQPAGSVSPQNFNTTNEKTQNGFIENKGQIHDQDYRPNPSVKYLLHTSGINVQLRTKGFSYDVYEIIRKPKVSSSKEKESQAIIPAKHAEPEEDITYKFHRIDIELLGANPQADLLQEGPSADYYNYYNAVTPESGATLVRHYQKITYKNIYPGIDLEFLAQTKSGGGVKYNFIVHPGADLSLVKLKYNGASETGLENGSIKISLGVGVLNETLPLSYELESNEHRQIEYEILGNNIFGFKGDYKRSNTLVVDPIPSRLWGTYYGGNAKDWAKGCAADRFGNVFMTGVTESNNAMATVGSHQNIIQGTVDGFLVKFDSLGARLWATYYGGSGDEVSNGCTVDNNGNSVMAGTTNSNSAIAVTGGHQSTFGGGNRDAFLVKFDNNGTRLWSTYYGGNSTDEGNACVVDLNGKIFIAGTTKSINGIATSGVHQNTIGNGDYYDAFLAKFSEIGLLEWGTYYGGEGYDLGTSCATEKNGTVVLSGSTASYMSMADTTAHQSTLNHSTDAFVVKFTSTGTRLWGTYFGGSFPDEGYSCAMDSAGNVVLTGITGNLSIVSPGAFQNTHGGNNDAFLVKFAADGTFLWSTYFGGTGADHGNACAVDSMGNIYLAGMAISTNLATNRSYQGINAGKGAAFLAKFSSSGARIWCSFYGGSEREEARSLALGVNGKMFLAGSTHSSTHIWSAGHQSTYGGNQDAFLVCFFECLPAPIISGTDSVCKGSYNTYSIPSETGHHYTWFVKGGTIISGQNTADITVNWTSIGVGELEVLDSIPGTDCINISMPFKVNIGYVQLPRIYGPDSLCLNDTATYSTAYSENTKYIWEITGGTINSGQGSNIIHVSWNTSGTGSLTVKDSLNAHNCFNTSSVYSVKVFNPPALVIVGPDSVCSESIGPYSVASHPDLYYRWMVNGGTILSGQNTDSITVLWNSVGPGELVLFDSLMGLNCKNTSVPFPVTIVPQLLNPILGPDSVCKNADAAYQIPSNPNQSLHWTVVGGNILSGQNTTDINVQWFDSAGGLISIRAGSQNTGCVSTSDKEIFLKDLPQPSAAGPISICETDTALFIASEKTGINHFWYPLSGNVLSGQNSDSVRIFWNTAGKKTVILTDSSYHTACTASDTIEVNLENLAELNLGNDTLFCGNVTKSYNFSGKADQILWNDGSTLLVRTITQSGLYQASFQINGCSYTDTVIIEEFQNNNLTLTGPKDLCGNDSGLYFISKKYDNMLWSSGSTDSFTWNNDTGWLKVSVSESGCSDYDSIDVWKYVLQSGIQGKELLCTGDSNELFITEKADGFLWSGGEKGTGVYAKSPGLHWVEIYKGSCIFKDSFFLTEIFPPTLNLGKDSMFCLGKDLSLFIPKEDYTSLLWHDGSAEQSRTFRDSGRYSAVMSNQCGETSDTLTIKTIDCDCRMFIPNAFTPNGDGLNDRFTPNICEAIQFRMLIFNRWGQIIYETNSPNKGWDGNYASTPALESVYAYQIVVRYFDGTKNNFKGNFHLLRP